MIEAAAKDITDRRILSREVHDVTEKFLKACHGFDSFRDDIQKFKPEIADDAMLNWHLQFEAIHKLNFCLFIVPSEHEHNIEIPKVRNSMEFIKDVSSRVIFVLTNLENDTKIKTMLQHLDFIQVKRLFMEIEKSAAEIQVKILETMRLEHATSECSNYHQSILDIQFTSRILNSVVRNIDESSNRKNKHLGVITDMLNIVKMRINLISNRFKGSIAHLCTRMLESLDELVKFGGEAVQKVFDKILNGFISLAARFLDLIGKLTEGMFKFLTDFGTIAQTKGYKVSKIDIKIPSVKFEPVPLFGFSVPLPKMESPEVLFSVETKSL
jgi:hypothetical protein